MLWFVLWVFGCSSAPYEGDDPGECTDGADNDQDQAFDCDDDGCAASPDCQDEGTDGGNDDGGGGNGGTGGGDGGGTDGGGTDGGGAGGDGGSTTEAPDYDWGACSGTEHMCDDFVDQDLLEARWYGGGGFYLSSGELVVPHEDAAIQSVEYGAVDAGKSIADQDFSVEYRFSYSGAEFTISTGTYLEGDQTGGLLVSGREGSGGYELEFRCYNFDRDTREEIQLSDTSDTLDHVMTFETSGGRSSYTLTFDGVSYGLGDCGFFSNSSPDVNRVDNEEDYGGDVRVDRIDVQGKG